ncbi:peptidyl-prolyl cis-trans isomerase E, putative [Eimeria tenella]|uniref:Peptidyl-prolyl cis-trans isomerase E, putative n=1 Tax=Eimeria tenella TaxID=5802 RepID=U6L3C4_EIMTE|nr:peptidyl-prolyl cis-trans isomerase E, putative [Eimeria tenella]CDJ44666.1 peptidyl-prolyl cis-trans isomerase E, putative [Eimeria tenella]|eukprot:XP_013235414.1 peptidyl-prolyl cis-trans isomerase E, putative [Eimeria tenella]
MGSEAGESRLKRTLYIGGLAEEVDEQILRAAFLPFGDIREATIPKDRTTGGHRGFGFVEFEEEEDANQAILNMHNSELYGRTLRVNTSRHGPQGVPKNRAVWQDDFFFREEMSKRGMAVDADLDEPDPPAAAAESSGK